MRKHVTRFIFATLIAAMATMPQASHAIGLPQEHVFYVSGTSTISQISTYAQTSQTDGSGIHRPTTLPPTLTGGQCNLVWDTGGLLTHECAGLLTATTGNLGNACVGDTDPADSCSLQATTWFYGYCGDTYGGDPNGGGSFKWNGATWTISRLGFPAGQSDTWEFNGLLTHNTQRLYMRLYLTAAPNKQGEQAGCGAFLSLPPATAILFTGTLILTDTPLPRAYQNIPGEGAPGQHWYSCDGTDGC